MNTTNGGRFDVLFYGVIDPGLDVRDVKTSLSQSLKADEQKINRLFTGQRRVIKRDATRQEAEHIQRIFKQAGAVVTIQDQNPSESPRPPAPRQSDSPKAPSAPEPGIHADDRLAQTPNRRSVRLIAAPAAVGFFAGLIVAFALGSLFGPPSHTLTEEEEALLAQMRGNLRDLNLDVQAIEDQQKRYSGGLVRTMLDAREETVRLSIDLLNQRIIAIEGGASLEMTTPSLEPDQTLANELGIQLERQAQRAEEADNAATGGGLIGALSAATAATEQQAEAMLRLRYLSAKYGLPITIPAARGEDGTRAATSARAISQSESERNEVASTVSDAMPDRGGPFGLAMGMKKTDFKGQLVEISPGKYLVEHVPRPHDAFETYAVKFGPDTGLCYIKAISKDIETSRYGYQLRSHFESLEQKLADRYGDHKTTDLLLHDSIWNEPRDWMMAMLKNERMLSAAWKAEHGSRLPSQLSEVLMLANASTSEEGYVAIDYHFDNYPVCSEALEAEQDDVL